MLKYSTYCFFKEANVVTFLFSPNHADLEELDYVRSHKVLQDWSDAYVDSYVKCIRVCVL